MMPANKQVREPLSPATILPLIDWPNWNIFILTCSAHALSSHMLKVPVR